MNARPPLAAPRAAESLAVIAPERIPFPMGVTERFGVDRSMWRALVEAVFPMARTPEGIVLALSYCKARRLDPMKKPVHVVPIWDRERRTYVDTVWPGIGELRITAMRTGQFAGSDPCTFGPDRTTTFSGRVGRGEREEQVEVTVTYPEWAQITFYRMIRDQRVAVPGPRVYWLETYAAIGRSTVPNEMWQRRPRGQLEKCAEAAALRRAFAEEIGNELTVDEASADMPAAPSVPLVDADTSPAAEPEPVAADEQNTTPRRRSRRAAEPEVPAAPAEVPTARSDEPAPPSEPAPAGNAGDLF